MTQFFTLLGFIAELPKIAHDVHTSERKIVERATKIIQSKAKSTIGRENGNWPPLAPSTIADKQKHGFPTPKPLLRTGALRDSIEVTIVSDHEAWIGTDNPIAPFQEFGTSRIPPRSFLASAAMASEDKIHRLAAAVTIAALSGHGRHAHDALEMLHLLHRAGHALKELGEDLLDPDDSEDGHK